MTEDDEKKTPNLGLRIPAEKVNAQKVMLETLEEIQHELTAGNLMMNPLNPEALKKFMHLTNKISYAIILGKKE